MKKLEFKISTDGISPRSVCNGGIQGDEAATKIVFKIEEDLKAKLKELQYNDCKLQFRIDITDGAGGFLATDALSANFAAETPEIIYTIEKNISSAGGIANFFLIISALDKNGNLCLDKYSYPCRVRFYPSVAAVEIENKETFSGALADAVKKAADRANAAEESADKAETSASSAADSAAAAGSSASEAANSVTAAAGSASEAAASAANASASAAAAASSASEAANSVTAAAGSASEAAASAASAALSAEAVNPDSYYKKDAADKQFAERSSENSADPSSVAYAKAMWIKQDDTGENSAAFLWDDYGENSNVLWSSKKTMETVREERGKLSANAVKKTVSGQTVQINDASPLIHELDISVSKNIFPKTYNILHDKFSFSGGAVTGTVEADGKIIININSRTAETLAFDVCTFNLSSGTEYIYSGNPNGCSYGSYFSRITRTSGAEMHPLTTDADTKFTVDYGGEFKFTILIQAHRDPQQIVFKPRLGVADAADEVVVAEYDGNGKVTATAVMKASGTVKGITSLYPTMKIATNNPAYMLNVTYNRDINKAFSETYSKDDADKQFAERSSENSADDSSVAFAASLWQKGDDTGGSSSAILDDSKPANDVYIWSSKKTMDETSEKITAAIEEYKTVEFDSRYAARSSPNSQDSSSVSSAKGLWVAADDTGENGTAELQDSMSASGKVLWSSKKTMETVREEQNKRFCNALKGLKSGGAVPLG